MDFLRKFISEGGVFKKNWGQRNHVVFQTATQLGSYYLDVANDTVDIKKPKIEMKLMNDSLFRNIESIKEYLKIMSVYQNKEAIPNFLYPNLAPYFPFFTLDQSGKIIFKQNSYLTYLVFQSNGAIIHQYLKQSAELDNLVHNDEIDRYFKMLGSNKSLHKLLVRDEYYLNNPTWCSYILDSEFTLNYNLCKSIAKLYSFPSGK
jgi:hypothetical protein